MTFSSRRSLLALRATSSQRNNLVNAQRRNRRRKSHSIHLMLESLEERVLLASDFGDAPLPYRTLSAENGAEHVAAGPTLGANRDTEADGIHSVDASADDSTGMLDDEDGVILGTILVGQLRAAATVNVQNAPSGAKLDAWLDFNGDGSWGGPMEEIASSVAVMDGDNTLTFDVPSWAIDGMTIARFRLSTAGNLGPEGVAADGEVEDYRVTLQPPAAASGLFNGQTVISTAYGAHSVFAADVDGDGDLDVLSASIADDKIAWYENDGSQNFSVRPISNTADGARSVFSVDVDGDGDLDVLSASANDDKIAWYENDGNQNFTARTISTAADNASSVFGADLDGDGDLDVLSVAFLGATIAWYENDGAQNFVEHVISTSGATFGPEYRNGARSVYVADVDGDGDHDVLATMDVGNNIAWYENDGSQNFTTRIISTADVTPTSLAAADMDRDGDLDILSASLANDTIAWYENDGSQNFTPQHVNAPDPDTDPFNATNGNADGAYSVFAADMDGDGDLDVLSASRNDDKIAWYENDGSQNFAARTISTDADSARSVFAADVDGDGDLDVLSASAADAKIAWYENLRGFDFGDAPRPYPTTVTENGARHAFVGPTLGANRDRDVSVTNSVNADADDTTGSPDDEDGVTFGSIMVGQLGAIATVNVQGITTTAKLDAWLDFNRDGSWGGPMEQIASNVAVLNGDNTLSFDVPSWAIDGTTVARFRLSTAGNLGWDGAAADGEVEDYSVTLYPPAVASGVFNAQAVISTTANAAFSVFAADLDGDGDLDVLSASRYDNKIAWYENDGSQNFNARTISTTANGAFSVFAADVDGDGDVDVLSASHYDDKIAWYENDGSRNFTARTISNVADGVVEVIAADMDGDGDLDVVSTSVNDDQIAWYENDGSQNFTAQTISTAADAYSVFAADVDGDGDLDVLSALAYDGRIAWYENDGSQNFTARTVSIANLARSVFAADMDGDGDLDVLSAASGDDQLGDDKIAWYENDGSQNFTAQTISTAVDGAWDVFAADMDGDGDLDVLSASFDDDKIAWYENDGSQNFTARTISTTADAPFSVFAADLDGDGDLDVLSASRYDDKIAWYENAIVSSPVADAGGPYVAAEGGTVLLTGAASSDPNQESGTLTYEWDLDNDGVFGETGGLAEYGNEVGIAATFSVGTLDGPIDWPISLRVTDDEDQSSTSLATINITNVAPVVEAGASVMFGQGNTFSRSGSFVDPGTESWTATVDYGDNHGPEVLPLNLNTHYFDLHHIYADPGVYTVTVTVSDGNESGSDTFLVTVLPPFIVNSTVDKIDLNPGNGFVNTGVEGEVTLRAAIMEANALQGDDTIILPPGTYTLTLTEPSSGDDGWYGDLDITDPTGMLTITGAGADTTIIDASLVGDRVFHIYTTAAATFDRVAITGGADADTGQGGGILNFGTAVIENSRVSQNSAFVGGGIHAGGPTTITDTVISQNEAVWGAGVYHDGHVSPATTIVRSTISRNSSISSGGGGGIFGNGGTGLTVSSSTISGNTAVGWGGGIRFWGSLSIHNSTVTDNFADSGGGVFNDSGTLELVSTIIGANNALHGPDGFLYSGIYPATVNSLGHNLIGNNGEFAFTMAPGDLIGTPASPIDPKLGPLRDNGGLTPTHSFLESSPAIDAGDDTYAPTTDQRGLGFSRIVDGDGDSTPSIDIGAFELQGPHDLAEPEPEGSFDATFGVRGAVISSTPWDDFAEDLAIAADGKLVVLVSDTRLVRLQANGSLDSTFGNNGTAFVPAAEGDGFLSLATLSDGKVIVGGHAQLPGTGSDFVIARLHPDGSLDTSFGANGKSFVDFGSAEDLIEGMTIQPDGKIVLVGATVNGLGYDFAIARLNADGSLDSAFGTNGKVTLDLQSDDESAYAAASQLDGKLVVAGYTSGPATGVDAAVVRLNVDGTVDSTFGTNGRVMIDSGVSPNSEEFANHVAIQSNGKILVGGATLGADNVALVVRLLGNGSLDSTFDTDGIVTTAVGNSASFHSLAIQADGRILGAGSSVNDPGARALVVRYNPNGSLDTSFGDAGIAAFTLSSTFTIGRNVALQSDNRIVVTGSNLNDDTGRFDAFIARFKGAPVPSDPDGVSDEVENAAPNNGDGNGDGLADSEQPEVASVPNSNNQQYVTLVSPAGTSLAAVEASSNPSPADSPPGIEFPIGHVSFSVENVGTGAATTVTLLLPDDTQVNTYYKYSATPDNPTLHWYTFLYDGTTGAEIFAGPDADTDPEIIILHFVDGQRGDEDLSANGVIRDPGGPGQVQATATTIDPGAYTGQYVIGGQTYGPGPVSLDLAADTYSVFIAGISRFTFSVDVSRQVTSNNSAAAMGLGNTLTFNTTTIVFDPVDYDGYMQLDGVAFSHAQVQEFVVIPNVNDYTVFIGGSSFRFNVDADGNVISQNSAAAQGIASTLQLITTTILVDPGDYTGYRALSAYFEVRPSYVVVPNLRNYVLYLGDAYLTFDVDAIGNVISNNPQAAHGEGAVLHLHNTVIEVDPGNYGGYYALKTTYQFAALSYVLVPNVSNYVVQFSEFGSVRIDVDATGNVFSHNPLAVQSSGNLLTFQTATIHVDPDTYTGLHNLHPTYQPFLAGPQCYVLVTNVNNYMLQLNTGNRAFFSITADGQPTPASFTFVIDEQPHTFNVSSGNCNAPPLANIGGPYMAPEGDSVVLSDAGGSDPDQASNTLTYRWDLDGDGIYGETGLAAQHGDEVGIDPTFLVGTLDGPSTWPISLRVTDDGNLSDTKAGTIQITNVSPTAGVITAPLDPVAVSTTIDVNANFADPGVLDTHTAVWDWGDSTTSAATVTETNGSGSVTGSHTYSAAGVYTVTLTVTDDDTGVGTSSFQYVVVYDPSAGFVTGGGWINSPPGAFPGNPALAGKANFGFVSKYQNGATVPTGNTEFQFKAAGVNFKSTSYEWLVVSGAKARFRGVGTVNGAGGYGFELTAWDGQVNGGGGVDKFRIQVWQGNQGQGIVYDNMLGTVDGADPTTALGGGSIVIHKSGNNLMLDAGGSGTHGDASHGDDAQLTMAREDALALLAAQGLSSDQIHQLQNVRVVWADLPGKALGLASDSTNYLWLDRDAAGYGWSLPSAALPTRGVDLLSTLTHELGHTLGFDHDVLGESLRVGERRVTMLAVSRSPERSPFGGWWFHDAGRIDRMWTVDGESSRDAVVDESTARRSLRVEIEPCDEVWIGWSDARRWSTRRTGDSAEDAGPGLSERVGLRKETGKGLDEDLLVDLAMDPTR